MLYSERHTFGTEYRNATKDLKQTTKAMGQIGMGTTLRYQQPETRNVGDAINARNEQKKCDHGKWSHF